MSRSNTRSRRAQWKATAVATNVPGPKQPVYLAGTSVRGVLVWARHGIVDQHRWMTANEFNETFALCRCELVNVIQHDE